MKKIVVIGSSSAGATAAARLRRLDIDCQIHLYEKEDYVTLADDAYIHYLSDDIKDLEDLQMRPKYMLENFYRVQVHSGHLVEAIHRESQEIQVICLETGQTHTASYDYLILATGSSIPQLSDRELRYDNLAHLTKLKERLSSQNASKVSLLGNTKESVELADFFAQRDWQVNWYLEEDRLLSDCFDDELSQIIQKSFFDRQVNFHFETDLETEDFEDGLLISARKPLANVELACAAGLKIGESGGIVTDAFQQTSDPRIYATGSCAEYDLELIKEQTSQTSDGYRQQAGRKLANSLILEEAEAKDPYIKKLLVKVDEFNYGSMGLTELDCQLQQVEYDVSVVLPGDSLRLLPSARPIFYKLIFQKTDGLVLGAQVFGRTDICKHLDVVSLAIQDRHTIYDMKDYQLSYSAESGNAKEASNIAAMNAINILEGRVQAVNFTEVRQIVEDGGCIVDTRSPAAFDNHHIKGAINIPYEELEEKMDQIPKDQPVYLYCTIGQRSSYMGMELRKRGYDMVYNIQGSILPLSFFEYFRDQSADRPSILTDYYLIDHY